MTNKYFKIKLVGHGGDTAFLRAQIVNSLDQTNLSILTIEEVEQPYYFVCCYLLDDRGGGVLQQWKRTKTEKKAQKIMTEWVRGRYVSRNDKAYLVSIIATQPQLEIAETRV